MWCLRLRSALALAEILQKLAISDNGGAVLHCDLRLEQFAFSSGSYLPKLIDFGGLRPLNRSNFRHLQDRACSTSEECHTTCLKYWRSTKKVLLSEFECRHDKCYGIGREANVFQFAAKILPQMLGIEEGVDVNLLRMKKLPSNGKF